jgi:hypothetical protein
MEKTGTAQLMYRNLAAMNVWLMLREMDPGLPPLEALGESEVQRLANDIFDTAMRTWWRQTEKH